jgi:hypothetical protein
MDEIAPGVRQLDTRFGGMERLIRHLERRPASQPAA